MGMPLEFCFELFSVGPRICYGFINKGIIFSSRMTPITPSNDSG